MERSTRYDGGPLLPNLENQFVIDYISKLFSARRYNKLPVCLGYYDGIFIEVSEGDSESSVYQRYKQDLKVKDVKQKYLDLGLVNTADRVNDPVTLRENMVKLSRGEIESFYILNGSEVDEVCQYAVKFKVDYTIDDTEWDALIVRRV